MSEKNDFTPLGNWLEQIIRPAQMILDAGCGPQGSHWWEYKAQQARMVAVDLYNQPAAFPSHTEYVQEDIAAYCETAPFEGAFDLVVADHILEHVYDPPRVALGFNRLLSLGGLLHVGVPDASNFTDRFYRLIHPDLGGHISQFTRASLLSTLEQAGFECLAIRPWGDDWGWFRNLYDPHSYQVMWITKDDIHYIADVFKRELTVEKGYFYGWEAVFVKRAQRELPPPPSQAGAEPAGAGTPDSEAPYIPPLSAEEIVELRWIASQSRRFKRSPLYQWLKRLFGR